MSGDYRIKPAGGAFIVVDPWDEQVGTLLRGRAEEAAKQDIERCKKEEAMYESAKLLVDIAIKVHMQMHRVDRETARYWVNSAMDVAD